MIFTMAKLKESGDDRARMTDLNNANRTTIHSTLQIDRSLTVQLTTTCSLKY